MEGAKPGHTVQFQGLKGAAHLNGTEGTLVKYLKKEARWSVRCDNDDGATIVKAKPENLVRKYVKPKQVTKKDYDMKSFDDLFREDGYPGGETTTTTTTNDDVTDFRSILSPFDGMPPLWPHPPKWPFHQDIAEEYAARLSLPLFLLSTDQRVADYAHRHFNHLADMHAKNHGAVKPASEWATIICGPSCWDPRHLGTDSTPCTAEEFRSRMMCEVFQRYGFNFIRRYEPPQTPIPAFCDECGKECTSECGSCGEIYCSRECMKKDWPHHKSTCETIYENQGYIAPIITQMEMRETLSKDDLLRAVGDKTKTQSNFTDEELFKEPSQREDCPICLLPFPFDTAAVHYQACCGKLICMGCIFACCKADLEKGREKARNGVCPYCREKSLSAEEGLERTKNRAANDQPISIHQLGSYYTSPGSNTPGLSQDLKQAVELRLRAGELGWATSYHSVASAYAEGLGVKKSFDKVKYYSELAAIGGDVQARHNLGGFELKIGSFDRAMKHYMIAAAAGYNASLTFIKWGYSNGHLSKDDLEKVLRSYQKAQDEMKSEQREVAAKIFSPESIKRMSDTTVSKRR